MFILKGKAKHYTKDVIKTLEIIILSILFIALVIIVKYKPVYTVTLAGETLGYVEKKSELENKINEYINQIEGTVALIDISVMPDYNFTLISRDELTKEDEIFEKIQETAVISYKSYVLTINGEGAVRVNTEIEAQDIISNLSSDLKEGVDFNVGYVEVISGEPTADSADEALATLTGVKVAKTSEYEAEQARIEQERIEAEKAAEKAEMAKATAIQTKVAGTSISYGNINGMSIATPLRVNPVITSRFGERSNIRSSSHTGLDLATALGTPIYPISEGTVTFSGSQGSYGYMIIVDHGNGIQSWYAHCNTLNVGVGNVVTTETVIGTVGSTGNSTGPHLHLEIRVNGTAVNPQNYLY